MRWLKPVLDARERLALPLSRTSLVDRSSGLLARLRPREADAFATGPPSAQSAIDAVPVAWASRFPAPLDGLHAGEAPLFEDPRMVWAFDRLGGLQDRTVVELGPLEGAHSYMAQQAGAAHVTAVEANPRAFLKCLVVKELLGLDRCSFLCGDALEFLAREQEGFDVCVACGILYHMTEPVRLLELISRRASRLVMWTHFYDQEALAVEGLAERMGPAEEFEHDGFRYRAHRHQYRHDARLAGFWGGTQAYSLWLPRADLLAALEHLGWREVEVAFEERQHPHGPALALVATRPQ